MEKFFIYLFWLASENCGQFVDHVHILYIYFSTNRKREESLKYQIKRVSISISDNIL